MNTVAKHPEDTAARMARLCRDAVEAMYLVRLRVRWLRGDRG